MSVAQDLRTLDRIMHTKKKRFIKRRKRGRHVQIRKCKR